ncbi:MAG: hypothetical protein NT151_09870 [Acidobacteria bacterium]|nr:hypothetical protein [Acidobacteriota bacterium]
MEPIDRKKADRFAFLEAIYNRTDGASDEAIDEREIGSELGWTDDRLEAVVQYLTAERLIECVAFGHNMGITHEGICEYERAVSEPGTATTYFPPVNIINVERMEHSQIQQGSRDSVQTFTMGASDAPAVQALLSEIRTALSHLDLPGDGRQSVESDVNTIAAQLSNPTPKRSIVADCLQSIRHVLEAGGGHLLALKIAEFLSR